MSKVTKSARKSLIWLGAILIAGYGLLAVGVFTNNTAWAPGLALDLAGGRQIILSPVLEEGATQEVDQADLQQAVAIIRQRINATGVAESEITVQGSNIVVALPGTPSEDTVDMVAQAAQLQFRPVLLVGDPRPINSSTPQAETSAEPEASAEPEELEEPAASPTGSEVSYVVGSDASADAVEPTDAAEPTDAGEPTDAPATGTDEAVEPDPATDDPSSFAWLTPDLLAEYESLNCLDPNNLAGRTMGNLDTGHVACAENGIEKLVLGPVEAVGGDLETASSGPAVNSAGSMTGGFAVRLQFNAEGAAKFNDTTTRLVDLESPRNQFAVVLDGVVITHPAVNQRISNGEAEITGDFTQVQAEQLASQLKFGALPLSLEVQSNQQISATLGADQLEKGLIAGLIGLLLVFVYSFFQYRVLGLVTAGSLTMVGLLTFGLISLMSWGIGYRLSLAGVAGLIIAVGVTADSFIVYFERIRDEIREGRSLQSAVDHAWQRARRTILISDAVSLVAAVTLYILAVGGVRGFAFTLGLTTVLDVVIVFLFTHPVMVLLARTRFFAEGHKWSGLDPRSLGRESLYKGRGRVRSEPVAAVAAPDDGLTLAERKAAAKRAQADASAGVAPDGEAPVAADLPESVKADDAVAFEGDDAKGDQR